MADTYVEDAGVGRRELLKKTAIGGGLVVAALAAPGLTGTAEAKGGKSINLWVVADFGTFLQVEVSPGNGPFYIAGDIFAQSATSGPVIGRFECWGFIQPTSGAVVSQEFRLDDRGKIIIAGVEGDAPRAVTGGTGDFRNARGEGFPSGGPGEDASLPGDVFTIDFNLTGARGPSIV